MSRRNIMFVVTAAVFILQTMALVLSYSRMAQMQKDAAACRQPLTSSAAIAKLREELLLRDSLPNATALQSDIAALSGIDGMAAATAQLQSRLGALQDRIESLASAPCPPPPPPPPPPPSPPPAIAAAKPSTDARQPSKWLVIGIPTIPRAGDADYLRTTLSSIANQLPQQPHDPMYGQVLVFVCNLRPQHHPVFDAARELFASNTHFKFSEHVVENSETSKDAALFDGNKPGWRVRQQTRDVVHVMQEAAGLASHYMFMEDDFELCHNGMLALQYAVAKAHSYQPEWTSIRFGYGLNGIVIRDRDHQEVARYLLKHLARRPPDHLLPEFMAKETAEARAYLGQRPNMAYRHVIFNHLGKVSSIRDGPTGDFPGCWTPLVYPVIFEAEAFNPKQCPTDDMWPCPPAATKVPHVVDFEKLCSFKV